MINVYCCISFMFLCLSHIYVWSKLYNEKIKYKNILLYICVFLMFTLGIITYFYVSAFLRMIIDVLLFCVCNFLIFKRNFNEAVVSTLYVEFLLTLSDVAVSLVLMIIFGISSFEISNGYLVTYSGNILVSIVLIIICNLKFVKKFYFKLVNLATKIKFKSLIVICMLVMISINFLMATIYFQLNPILIMLINSFLIIIYSFIVYRSITERNKSLLIQAENTSLMYSLHEYEDMVDRQRVDNHENKNQLLIIKNMIKKKDKDVVKYIDTIVKDKKEDDEALYTRVKIIPSGGLQGIIYQKMLTMKDAKILFSLDVSRDVRKVDLDSISMEDNYRLCKIVGALLDNAIEANLNVDDKRIMISLYVDDDMLVIEISNMFNNVVDIDKLDDEGYTTKGDGHGYGLSLVKKIVSESDKFINERKVKDNIFKQIIKVKVK